MNGLVQCLRHSCAIWLLAGLALPTVAFAQRTQDNAVAQSQDAFGKSVGNERTGLYSGEDVRGFSPVDAGNARIEGLYFDQIDRLPQRLQESSAVHVGISALHYPFPAPTGIVDYQLTKPGDHFAANIDVEYGDYGGIRFAAEMKLPLISETLGFSGGVGGRHQIKPEGGSSNFRNFGALLAWQPYRGASVLAYYGGINSRDDEAHATLFPAGSFLPPKVPRGVFLGQQWAQRAYNVSSWGVITKLPIGGFQLNAGVFHSQRDSLQAYSDLVTGVAQDGTSSGRTIIADGNNLDQSLSGEVRLTREWTSGSVHHAAHLSVRGRAKDRLFGGTQRISLGPSSAIAADFRPAPVTNLGPENSDKVRQITYGASYGVSWDGHGSIEGSIATSSYRKNVDFADPLRADVETRDKPLLWNVSASLILTSRLAFYAGFAKGQEEALIAPDIATNRSEAPPAIRTRQIDAGLRYAITPKLSLVAGVFSVKKPYFNLDGTQRYRQLGVVDNKGIEISLAGPIASGVSLVAGTVLMDPKISGEITGHPVGSLTRRSIVNLDWRLANGTSPLSLDMALESISARTANAANTLSAPARVNVNLGARIRFPLAGAKALVRVQVQNLFNEYSWNVSSSGGFTYSGSRFATAQLLVDF